MQIYLMNVDGSEQTRLTYFGANDDYPRWSPNGAQILFQSDRDNPETGFADVYLVNASGSTLTRLTTDTNDDSAPVWSPDGAKIAFQSMRNGVNYQIYVMNADGSGQVNISNSSANDIQPSWSPDGTKIAFATDRDQMGFPSIYVMNVDGGNQTRLTFGGSGVRDEQPAWTSDAMKLAFTSTRDSMVETWQETDDEGNTLTRSQLHINKEIYVMNADGASQIRLTNDLSNDDSPGWSTDGTKLIFRSERERDCCDPTSQVWRMNADGSNLVNRSNNEFGDFCASWGTSWIGIDASASQLADNASTGGNQPPVANAGGSYVGTVGQSVQLNGGASFDPDGSIIAYSWDFGDGTSSTSSNPTHQYNADGVYSVSLSVRDNNDQWTSSAGFVTVGSVSLPVRLTFDELPNNIPVGDQYFNQYGVKFSSANFFYPVHTYQNCGLTCTATSSPNFINTKPDDTGQVIVTFTQPVSNLVFYAIGVDTLSGTFGFVDIYRNGSPTPSNVFALNGVFSATVGFTSGSLSNINKIVIRGITDPAGIGFDDFSFNIPADVKITSGRVNGYLNGTTQNALLGADVALQASPLPGGFAGGTYAWTCTPSSSTLCSIVAGANSSSVTLRMNEVGTFTANVSYTKSGVTTSSSMTVNSILPTLTGFTAQQGNGLVTMPGQCNSPDSFWWYRLGCIPPQDIGMHFTTTVHAPTFISDPSQSGIKYVQAVSGLRKKVSRGLRCITGRSTESDVESGWQRDGPDPYNPGDYPPHFFSEGNDLTMPTVDYPKEFLTFFGPWEFVDSLYVDDQFWMYAVYFSGSDLSQPAIQRPIGKLRWNWGGLVVFDWNGSTAVHNLRYTNAPPISRTGENTTAMVTMHGIFSKTEIPCPSGPPVTNNRIDSSRYFVRQHYLDFLARDPSGDSTHPADVDGWGFWTS